MESGKNFLELENTDTIEQLYNFIEDLLKLDSNTIENISKFDKENFINNIQINVKEECIKCTNLIDKNKVSNENKIKKLHNFLNNFNDLLGEDYTKLLLKKVGFIENHIDETINSLKDVNSFRSNLTIDALINWNNKDFIQSVNTHKEIVDKSVSLEEDFFKPLVNYFVSTLTKSKKAEFLLKLDLIKKSGWAEYIFTEGHLDKDKNIVKLYNMYQDYKTNQSKSLDYKKQIQFKTAFEKFFETIEIGLNVNEKGLNVATINQKSIGLYNLATSGMPDGAIKGCFNKGTDKTLFVGWATANSEKYSQNLQWFRHLEGIDFSIQMKRKGFEIFNNVDGSIVSLAVNHDDENIGFISENLEIENKNAFQILGEITEISKGLSFQNGRFKSLINQISTISLIGSKTEICFKGQNEEVIKEKVFNIVKKVNTSLKNAIENNTLTDDHKVKREIYLNDFCNAITYLSEINKGDYEFKDFLNKEVSSTFIGLAKVYPEMSSHLKRTFSFSLMNSENKIVDTLQNIETNANIGFDKDFIQRAFYHFDDKIVDNTKSNHKTDVFVEDTFKEIKKHLGDLLYQNADFHKIKDTDKEKALWHILFCENIPNKKISDYEKNIKENVLKFKNKKTSNKCLEFLKDVQKGFPHLSLLSTVSEINDSPKERISRLINIEEMYIKNFGEIDKTLKFNQQKIEKINKIKKIVTNFIKDIEVLENQQNKDFKKELDFFLEDSIKNKAIDKNLIIEELNKFKFKSDIKSTIDDLLKSKFNNNKKCS